MEKKLTKLEWCWVLYDVGNSAFVLLTATILPIYFNYLSGLAGISEVDSLAYWGYAASISTMIVAVVGPVFGTLADTREYKKPIFTVSMMTGVLGCAALAIPGSWVIFLAVFVVAKVGYSSSLIFYDSMLADVTTPERMHQVSAHGYAWGYLGSCIPFLISLVFVLFYKTIGISMKTAMTVSFLLNAGWWLVVTIPLLKKYQQVHHVETENGSVVRSSLKRLGTSLKDLKGHRKIFLFLVSFFFYIDGVYTIIEMATAYGSSLGLDAQGLLLALLVTQIVAFPFALLFGKMAKKYAAEHLIQVCILAYMGIAMFAIQLDKQWEFWFLAFCVGMFQGAVQAFSRSYFAGIIPEGKSGEFFGLFDICGKGAAFIGTALMGFFAQLTGKPGGGISVLAVMFFVGLVLFRKSVKIPDEG